MMTFLEPLKHRSAVFFGFTAYCCSALIAPFYDINCRAAERCGGFVMLTSDDDHVKDSPPPLASLAAVVSGAGSDISIVPPPGALGLAGSAVSLQIGRGI